LVPSQCLTSSSSGPAGFGADRRWAARATDTQRGTSPTSHGWSLRTGFRRPVRRAPVGLGSACEKAVAALGGRLLE
jgi:hypothetical protein